MYLYNEILFGIRKEEVLMHGTAWADLETIVLSERSQP